MPQAAQRAKSELFQAERHLRRDGRVVWLKGTVTLVRDDLAGCPDSFLAVIEDRTLHRKAIQQALSESDKSFRVLTDNISDLFFTLDLDLRCSFWNRAAESLTGILASAVLGKSVGDAFSEGPGASKLEDDVPRSSGNPSCPQFYFRHAALVTRISCSK